MPPAPHPTPHTHTREGWFEFTLIYVSDPVSCIISSVSDRYNTTPTAEILKTKRSGSGAQDMLQEMEYQYTALPVVTRHSQDHGCAQRARHLKKYFFSPRYIRYKKSKRLNNTNTSAGIYNGSCSYCTARCARTAQQLDETGPYRTPVCSGPSYGRW